MMVRSGLFMLMVAASLVTGCASARLEVAVDIYSEDLGQPSPALVRDLVSIDTAVTNVTKSVRGAAVELAEIVDDAFKVYAASEAIYYELLEEKKYEPGENIKYVREQFEESKNTLRNHERIVETSADEALKAVWSRPIDELAILKKVHDFNASKRKFYSFVEKEVRVRVVGELNELMEETRSLEEFLVKKPEELTGEKRKRVNERISEFKQTIRLVLQRIDSLKRESEEADKLRRALIELVADDKTRNTVKAFERVFESTISAVQSSLTIAGAETDRISIREAALGLDFYISQIDRLQNPADPALRELTKPENEPKWQPYITKTAFYAEGDTSVVVVRDRPGHYSVKHGVNNPRALIKGQLNISRTLASGAIEVLGAIAGVAGVPVPKIGDGASDGTGSVPIGEPEQDDGQIALAGQKAMLDAEIRRRRNTRRGLLQVISRLQGEVEKETGPTVSEKTRELVRATLEGQLRLFQEDKP